MLNENFNSFLSYMYSLIRRISSHNNLSISQYFTIQSITKDGLSMSDLSLILGIDNSTLTRNINILIKEGLVTKEKSIFDRREHIILLTRDGYLILKKLDVQFNNQLNDIFSCITSDERNNLINSIEKVNWKLNCKINDV